MNDTIKTGIIAGLLGTLGDALVHYPCYFLFHATTTGHYISQLIFPSQSVTIARWLVGEVTHFSAGAVVGVLISFIYKISGSDYPYYKGVGTGIALWITHIAVIPNLIRPRPIVYRTVTETIVDLVSHIAYGVIVAAYLTRTNSFQQVK